MFCRYCGKQIPDNAVVCVGCGVKPFTGNKFCQNCGAETGSEALVCTKCGVKLTKVGDKDWLVALLLSIFLGGIGIDRFYLGYVGLGILKLIFGWNIACVWWAIDVILIACNRLKDAKGYELQKN